MGEEAGDETCDRHWSCSGPAHEHGLDRVRIEKSYGRGMWPLRRQQRVLRGVDLTLNPGEVVGLVGENGSGKYTLMKILVAALAADEGSVSRGGRLGYCPQEPQVYGRLTCDEHFELFGRAYRMTPAGERESRAGIYDALGFARYATTRADQLSGGTLAKLNLGLALLADPRCCCSTSRTSRVGKTTTTPSFTSLFAIASSWPNRSE